MRVRRRQLPRGPHQRRHQPTCNSARRSSNSPSPARRPTSRTSSISTCAALTPDATEVPGAGGECNAGETEPLREVRRPNCGRSTRHPGRDARRPEPGDLDRRLPRLLDRRHQPLPARRRGQQTGRRIERRRRDVRDRQRRRLDRLLLEGGPPLPLPGRGGAVEDLTPSGGLKGVLGTSADGAYVYYVTAAGLFLEHAGTVTPIASEVAEDSYPPTTGTARVSADGTPPRLRLLGNRPRALRQQERDSGEPEPEVYLFTAPGAPGAGIVCASCNPSGERPIGAAALPGASANGTGAIRLAQLQAARPLGHRRPPLLRNRRRARRPGHERRPRRLRVGGAGAPATARGRPAASA